MVQAARKAAIVRALGALPRHVRYAPADLATQQVAEVLASNGFDVGALTLPLRLVLAELPD